MAKDLYAVLGVERNATADEIRKAFRKEALKWHPDKNQNNILEAEEQFKIVAEAYEILGSEDKRTAYDRYGYENMNDIRTQQQPHFQHKNAHDIFSEFFGRRDPFESMFFNSFGGFSDFPSGINGQSSMHQGFGNSRFSSQRRQAFENEDSFFGGGMMRDPFGFPSFGMQSMGGFGGMNGGMQNSFSSTSQSFSSGLRGTSSSTRTTIINGKKTVIKTQTDSNGNTVTETTVDDGQGNVTQRITQSSPSSATPWRNITNQ